MRMASKRAAEDAEDKKARREAASLYLAAKRAGEDAEEIKARLEVQPREAQCLRVAAKEPQKMPKRERHVVRQPLIQGCKTSRRRC